MAMKEKAQRFIQAFRMNGEVKRKTILIGSSALAAIVALVLLLCLLPHRDTVNVVAPEQTTDTDIPKEPIYYEPIIEPKEMRKTMEQYPDVYAWLEVPGTAAVLGTEKDIDYPVAQHPTDRSFYLNHDLDGNSYQPGVLFTEAVVEDRVANRRDLNDPVTIIYGHNQKNRTMFGGLQAFGTKIDFDAENYMYLYQEDRRVTYQIVGGMMYESAHILYYHDFSNAEAFDSFFQALWSGKYAATHVDEDNIPVSGDRVLILLTCDNDISNDNNRYLLIGKMVEDTDELPADAIAKTKDMP